MEPKFMSPTESNENCTIYSISSIVMVGNDKKKTIHEHFD